MIDADAISVSRVAQIAGLDYNVVYAMLNRARMLCAVGGVPSVSLERLADVAPDLCHVLRLLKPALERKCGRPPINAVRYRKKSGGPK